VVAYTTTVDVTSRSTGSKGGLVPPRCTWPWMALPCTL